MSSLKFSRPTWIKIVRTGHPPVFCGPFHDAMDLVDFTTSIDPEVWDYRHTETCAEAETLSDDVRKYIQASEEVIKTQRALIARLETDLSLALSFNSRRERGY